MINKETIEKGLRLSEEEKNILSYIYSFFKETGKWPGIRTTHRKFSRTSLFAMLNRDTPVLMWKEKNSDLQQTYKLAFEGILFCPSAQQDLSLLKRFLEFLIEKFRLNAEILEITDAEANSALQLDANESRVLMELIKEGSFCGAASFGTNWKIRVPEDIEILAEVGAEQYIFEHRKGCFEKKGIKIPEFNNQGEKKATNVPGWKEIEEEFEVSKKEFGRRIKFVTNAFKRKVIFRDVEHAHALARLGFNKSAVILAGSVIEELLRLYLENKGLKPQNNNFDSYIKLCEEKKVLKLPIHRLTDSVRYFRNLVHLENEDNVSHTISKAAATTAIASIFTIAGDFN